MQKSIPLHMTMLHWFESSMPREEMAEKLQEFAASHHPIDVRATDADMFGPNKDVPVMRMELRTELVKLHLGLLATMTDLGADVDERWVGASRWSPHVTHRGERRLYAGDEIVVNDLDLIAKRPSGARELIARVPLSATIKR